MRFTKYHGIGNDFIMLADPNDSLQMSGEFVRRLCDRHFGIGGDGVIRVAPGTGAAALLMDYVNSDGSIGEMCGNGIRCLAIFAREEGMSDADEIEVDTRSGIKRVWILEDGRVRVDMGAPIFLPAGIPVRWDGPDALHAKVELQDQVVEAACLSMGNPHAALFVDDLDAVPVGVIGPAIEHHEMFPNKTNVEFVTVESPDRVRMRVWERGAGETLACGTGACAAAVASRLLRDTDGRVVVALPGGELELEWTGGVASAAPVLMTGPVTKSFVGEFDPKEYE